jgi:hypothetical protein
MKSIHDFIVKPIEGRYNNTVKVDEVDLIVNTRIEEFKSVSKVAEVVALPLAIKTNIKVGDKIIVHHNVFRRFYDIRGNEKNSRSFIKEDMYACSPEQIYLYGANKANLDYCFVKPLVSHDIFSLESEKPLVGILKIVIEPVLVLVLLCKIPPKARRTEPLPDRTMHRPLWSIFLIFFIERFLDPL